MLGKNKNKRTMDKRGEEEFHFDFHKEKNIYLYLWRMRSKEKELQEKFDTYIEWKQYVWDKHAISNKKELIEFSKYLTQRKRNLKPNREYANIFIPVLLTLVIEQGLEYILGISIDGLTLTEWWQWLIYIAIYLLIMLVFVLPMVMFCYHTMKPIWDNNSDESFLTDYKEIIDEMLQVRSEGNNQNEVNQDLLQHQIKSARKGKNKDREWKFEIRIRRQNL